jgi:serine/threonine protein kinase
MNNILYTDPNSCRFIDFGLSWQPKALTLSNIYDLYREFNPDIKQEPPEVSYINGIINKVDKKIIFAMIRDKKLGFYYMRKLIGIPIEKQLDDLIKFINTSWSFEEKNWYVFYSLYWSKIDAWALGVLFSQIYLELSVYKEFELSDEYKKRNLYMLTAIRGLCEADPGKRLDAAEALVIWNPDSPLLKEPDVQTWFLKQKKEREQLNKIRL